MVEIDGMVGVVTGSSAGVGRATAALLASKGVKVIVNYNRTESGALEIVEEIKAAGGEATAVKANVGEDADCRVLIQAAVDTYGGLQILVNNAGATHFIDHADLEAVTPEIWREVVGINVEGVFNCTRAAAPHMKAAGWGAVVNVSSVAGFGGGGSCIPYAASKAALNTMTKSLARVLGPEVRINTLAPGFIEGRWLAGGLGENYETARERSATLAPLKKVATPESLAEGILGLIQYAPHSTGQTIVADGGVSL